MYIYKEITQVNLHRETLRIVVDSFIQIFIAHTGMLPCGLPALITFCS